MPSLAKLKEYVVRRRTQINNELATLEALNTSRSVLFARATTSVTARAVQEANSFTNGAIIESVLENRIQDILTTATPAGLNDSSPVTGQDPLKLFLNEALVLLGLVLKANTSEVVRGMLSAPVSSLKAATTTALAMASQVKAVLDQITTEPIGQGIVLSPADARVTGLVRNLTQAKDGADRLKANVSGAQAIGESLAAGVQGFLAASLDSIRQDTQNLDHLRSLTLSMVNAGNQLDSANKTVESVKANIISFRANYEASFSGISADLVNATALSSNIGALLETVVAARDNLTNLAPYRFEWGKELAVLLALSKESKPTAAKSIFSIDTALSATYSLLVGDLKLVPPTDTATISASLSSAQGFLLGTFASASFKDQYDTLVAQTQASVDTFRNRMRAILAVLDLVTFQDTPVLAQLRDALNGSKLTNASDALEAGDIKGFLSLSVGSLNPADQIRDELQAVQDSGAVSGDLMEDITRNYSDILSFEQADIEADRIFEDSRIQSIKGLKSDLRRLDRVDSLVSKIEAL